MASLVVTLGKIERLQEELGNLAPVSKENNERLWKKFRLEWNYNSNHIEGNTLTYGETQLLLVFDKTTGDHEMREFEEMKAHDVAINAVKEWAGDSERELTEADIRDLNRIILVRPFWKEAITPDGQPTRRLIKVGDYKEHPNSVRLKNGEIFPYAQPEEVPQKMHDLIDWYRNNQDLSPVVLAAEVHYRFILIHPFDDGNGRVARLLVNYILMKNGLPPIIIKSAEKEKYLTALNKADVGDREAFHQYIAEQLQWSLELSVKAAKGENIEEPDDIDKEVELLAREAATSKIVEKKSRDVIRRSYLSFSESLYKPLEKKIAKFNTLFVESNKSYRIQNDKGLSSVFFDDIAPVEGMILDYSHDSFYNLYYEDELWEAPDYSEVSEFEIFFEWEGYRNSGLRNTFSLSYALDICYDEFSCRISFVDNADGKELISLEIPYGSALDKNKSEEFIQQVAKNILGDIKERSKI